MFAVDPNLHVAGGVLPEPGSAVEEGAASGISDREPLVAVLDAQSVQAFPLNEGGAIETLDFRHRPWAPGQPNRLAAGDMLLLEALVQSVQRAVSIGTLALLGYNQAGPPAHARPAGPNS